MEIDELRVAVTENVTEVNNPPVAVDDAQFGTAEDTALTVTALLGVLANDDDVDEDLLTATLVGQPQNGAVNLGTDGGFTYTPNLNFNGTDTFTYTATDGTATSGTATVSITVTAVNDPPTGTVTIAGTATEGRSSQQPTHWRTRMGSERSPTTGVDPVPLLTARPATPTRSRKTMWAQS